MLHSVSCQSGFAETVRELAVCQCRVFHAKSVSFLGFVITRDMISIDTDKVTAVAEWPVPEYHKHLRRFLGFANFYCRFIGLWEGERLEWVLVVDQPWKFCGGVSQAHRIKSVKKTHSVCLPNPHCHQLLSWLVWNLWWFSCHSRPLMFCFHSSFFL